jgi:hypothetical protein
MKEQWDYEFEMRMEITGGHIVEKLCDDYS